MLRIHILQNLYDLADDATNFEVIDSRAFSDFCNISSSNQIPSGDSIDRFRNLLVEADLQETLFQQVVEMFKEKGLILKKGTILTLPSLRLLLPPKIRIKNVIQRLIPLKKGTSGTLDTKLTSQLTKILV